MRCLAAMSGRSGHSLVLLTLELGALVWLCEVPVTAETHVKVDSHGYILYCPCLVTCFAPRKGPKRNDCNVKDGCPSAPFWDTFNVDFIGSEFYDSVITSLSDYDLENANVAFKWMNRFPPKHYPVIAFIGAPVLMPVNPRHNPLHRFLVWSDSVKNQAKGFVMTNIPSKPFVGVHIRRGQDWAKLCHKFNQSHYESWTARSYFLADQCLGNKKKHGVLPLDICLPPDELVMKQIERTLKQMKAMSLFVASNDRSVVTELKQYMKKVKVSVVSLDSPSPHVDLAVLAMADHFIGNCVSTFTAFAVRERYVHDKTVSFWASEKKVKHDEL